MSFLDGLSNQFSAFGKKTKDFADSTRLSSMASDEQRTISDIHREIGKLYASLHKTDHEACFDALFARLAQAEENLQRYTQQIQDLRGVRRCERCGAEIPKGSQFCSACGAPVPPAAPPDCDFCAHCGAAVKKGMRFCTSCGQPMMPQPVAAEPSAPVYTAPTPEPAYAEPVMPQTACAEPAFQEPVCAEPPAPEPVYAAPEMPQTACAEPAFPEPVCAEPPAPEPVYAAPEMPEPAPAAARRCAYCGSELEPDAAFCSECGHAV